MANPRVRIYRGGIEGEPSNIIGFSASALIDRDILDEFCDQNGLEGRCLAITSETDDLAEQDQRDQRVLHELGGCSWFYYEVIPPLSDEMINELEGVCIRNIDPGHNTGYLIDNRNDESPFESYDDRGEVIAQWS